MSDAMSDPNNTANVEAFLFELNELMERHKAMITPNGALLLVSANGHHADVDRSWKELNGRVVAIPSRLVLADTNEAP